MAMQKDCFAFHSCVANLRFPAYRKIGITEFDFPALTQENAFDAKALFKQFCENFDGTLQICKDRRFSVSVLRLKSDRIFTVNLPLNCLTGGTCYVLFVFASEKDYATVLQGDGITCRGNYLGVTNEFGVVMKRSVIL